MVGRFGGSGVIAVALAALVIALPEGVSAQEPEPTPETEYRIALMTSLQNHMRALGALVSGDVDYAGHVQFHASAVQGIATMAGDAFPAGTAGEGSRSSDAIWENWDSFTEKLQVLVTGAAALDAAAQSGDMAALDAARGEVGGSCRGCHTDFRLPAN